MEQRKKLTLAERKKMKPQTSQRRPSHQKAQERPSVGKKGARGQSAGLNSKTSLKGTVGKKAASKKPGRAKQVLGKGKQASKHKLPRRAE